MYDCGVPLYNKNISIKYQLFYNSAVQHIIDTIRGGGLTSAVVSVHALLWSYFSLKWQLSRVVPLDTLSEKQNMMGKIKFGFRHGLRYLSPWFSACRPYKNA